MDDACCMDDCMEPGKYRARIKWENMFGPGTAGLTRPLAFCMEHARSLRRVSPDAAVWLNEPDED